MPANICMLNVSHQIELKILVHKNIFIFFFSTNASENTAKTQTANNKTSTVGQIQTIKLVQWKIQISAYLYNKSINKMNIHRILDDYHVIPKKAKVRNTVKLITILMP